MNMWESDDKDDQETHDQETQQKYNFLIQTLGFRPEWCQFYGKFNIAFEAYDKEYMYDNMYAMLESNIRVQEYLIWHMKNSRTVFGPYNIESEVKFINLAQPFNYDFTDSDIPYPLDEKLVEWKGNAGTVSIQSLNDTMFEINVTLDNE